MRSERYISVRERSADQSIGGQRQGFLDQFRLRDQSVADRDEAFWINCACGQEDQLLADRGEAFWINCGYGQGRGFSDHIISGQGQGFLD